MTLTAAMLLATPVLAFLGAVLGQWVNRKGALELDRWRRREETLRMLRWAVELATDTDPHRQRAGLTTLRALLESPLLDRDDKPMVVVVATSVAKSLRA